MMLLFFFISLIVPLASVNKASALTPQQLQDCYFYNGKTVGSLVSSTSSGNTTAPNYTFQECQDMGACQKPASNTATISCANPTQQQAVDTKLGSAITTICGPSNAIGAAYNNCVNDVTNAYNACKNASTSTAAVDGTKEQAIAACIAGKVAGVNVAKLGTALTGSAAAAATLYTNEQACIKANGQWDAAASPPTCTGGNQDANPPTCEMSPNPLSWILCPVITGLVAGVDACRSILESLLVIRVEPDSEAYNDLFKAWSNIRIIGNIILAIALLVIVFGEVVGGGVIEAYTAKKVLPRLLIGAALINLSFYIVIAFVDIMNIVGLGIYSLMSSTVTGGGLHRVNIDILGGLLGNAGIGALIVGLATGSELLVAGLMFLAVFVLLPALLIMLAVLFVVIIRQGIILVLLILSPVAFALYCLPNTEKYFKKWWEEMFKALLVFPIIMAFFAVSTILSSLLGAADLGNATPFKMIVQLIVALAPIALVVMAFKIAGGLLGNIMEVSKGLGNKAHQGILGSDRDPTSLRNRTKQGLGDRWAQGRVGVESSTRRSGSGLVRRLGRAVGGGAWQQERAAMANQREAQRADVIWGNGDDTYTKASTLYYSMDRLRGTSRHRVKDGQEQFAATDGSWFTASEIKHGHDVFGGNHGMMQTNFKKMFEKADPMDTPTQNRITQDYMDWANGEKLDPGTATGRWQGVSIPIAQSRPDLRRLGIEGEKGNLRWGSTNDFGLLTQTAGFKPHEWTSMGPGGFSAVTDSIETVYNAGAGGGGNGGESGADRDAAAKRAYVNLVRAVEGARAGRAPTPPGAAAGGGSAPGAATPGSPMPGYSALDSAAAKNAIAAEHALETLHARNPGLEAWVKVNFPDDIHGGTVSIP